MSCKKIRSNSYSFSNLPSQIPTCCLSCLDSYLVLMSPSRLFTMKSCLVLISAFVSAATAKPLPDDESDQFSKEEIPQMPDSIAALPNQETNSIFTTNWPSSQYQPSSDGDDFVGLSNTYQSSTAGDSSAVLLGSLIPTDFSGGVPATAATGELVSEALFQSNPPCIDGFWPACCNGKKLCIWSKFDDS